MQSLVSVRERSQPGVQREPVLKVLTHAPRQPGSHYEPGKGRHRGPARQGSGVMGEWRVGGGGGGVTDVQGLCSSGPAGQQPSPTISYAPILDSHIARGNH